MRIRLQIQFFFIVSLICCCNQQLNAQNQDREQKFVDSLLKVLPLQKDDSAKALILINITRMKMGDAQNTGNWDEAIEWAQKTLNLSTKTNYQFGIGRANINLGQCWIQKGNYAEAIKYFYAGLNLSFKNGRKVLTVASSGNLAQCYMSLGNYKEALKYHLLAYETTQQLNNDGPADLQQIAAGIAKDYAKLHNYEEALKWYQKALPDDPELFYEGDITLQIATILMEMKRYDEALKKFRDAVQLFPARFKRLDAQTKGLLGDWFHQLGEAYFNIGTLTKDKGRISAFKKAINYLNMSIPLLGKNAGGKESLMNAYTLLKKVSEELNDYKNALRYSNLYTQIKDSIYNKTTYLKMADLKVQYETEKAAAEIKAKQEKIVADKQRINNLLFMGLSMVIIISLFSILLIRQKNKKRRAVEKAETLHKMSELELQSLRAQLNPHFMFNSLNSIQALILKEENEKSQSYLSRFAKLLRLLLENADKPFIPLSIEIDFLKLYLSLETLRVPELEYSIYTDPELNTEEILIPNMILQPYVENAIWHGLSYKEGDKQLQIRINRANEIVQYEIEDNGVGRIKSEEMKSLFRKQNQSKGMELLNKRFKLLNAEYNSKIQSTVTDVIKDNEVAGTLVTLQVPVEFFNNFKTKT